VHGESNALLRKLNPYDRTYLAFLDQVELDRSAREAISSHFATLAATTDQSSGAVSRNGSFAYPVRRSHSVGNARSGRQSPVLAGRISPGEDQYDEPIASSEGAPPLALLQVEIDTLSLTVAKNVCRRHKVNPDRCEYYMDVDARGLRVRENSDGIFGKVICINSLSLDDHLSDTVQNKILRLTPLERENPLLLLGNAGDVLDAYTGLRYEVVDTQTIVTVGSVVGVASASLQRSLGRLIAIPEGSRDLQLPPRKQVAKAQEAISKAAPPRTSKPAWVARCMHVHLTMPQTYHQEVTRGLVVSFNNGCFYPEVLSPEEHVKYSSTMCEFGSLLLDVVWLRGGELDPDFAARLYAPMLVTDQLVTFAMKVSRDYDNLDWIWQQPHANSPAGRVEVNLTTGLYSDFNHTLCAVMRHWAYDKYSEDEARFYEYAVKLMGPWMVTQDEGTHTCESRTFVPFVVSHPKPLHWGWYNCLRFDAVEGELCPFYMHLNPLSHATDASVEILPAHLLPDGVRREHVIAYIVPQDGCGPGATKNYYVSFMQCSSSAQKTELLANINSSLKKEREKPTVYRNTKDPRNTWSSQRYAVSDMSINFRESRDQAEPVSTIHIPGFVYTQVNRQHDWEINVFADHVTIYGRDPPPLPPGSMSRDALSQSSRGAATDRVICRLRPPRGQSLVTYNIVHTTRSPLATDGLPLWGGTLRIDDLALNLKKDKTLLAVKRYFSRMGVEFGDAHSLMWQLTLVERGGAQLPFEQDASYPWTVNLHNATIAASDEHDHRLLDVQVRDLTYVGSFKSRKRKTLQLDVASISAQADGVEILNTSGFVKSSRRSFGVVRRAPSAPEPKAMDNSQSSAGSPTTPAPQKWLSLSMVTYLAYEEWVASEVNVAQTTDASVGAVDIRVPWPKALRRLKRWVAFPAVEPSEGLFERVTRIAGNREGRRAAEAEERRQQRHTMNLACSTLTNAALTHVGVVVAEGPRYDGEAAIELQVSDVAVTTTPESGARPSVRMDIGVRAVSVSTTHNDATTPLLKPFAVNGSVVQRFTVRNDGHGLVCKTGWNGPVNISPVAVTLSALQYTIIMNTTETYAAVNRVRAKGTRRNGQPNSDTSPSPSPIQPSPTASPDRTNAAAKPPAGPNHLWVDLNVTLEGLSVEVSEHESTSIVALRCDPVTVDFKQRVLGDLDIRVPQIRMDAVELGGAPGRNPVVLLYGAPRTANDVAPARGPLAGGLGGSGLPPRSPAADSSRSLSPTPASEAAFNGVADNISRSPTPRESPVVAIKAGPLFEMTTTPAEKRSQIGVSVAPLAILATPPFLGRIVTFSRSKRAKSKPNQPTRRAIAWRRRQAYHEHYSGFNSTLRPSDTGNTVNTGGSGNDIAENEPYFRSTLRTSEATATPGRNSPNKAPPTSDSDDTERGRSGGDDDRAAEAGELDMTIPGMIMDGDTHVTSEEWELQGDAFLCPARRLIFNRPHGRIIVRGNHNTMFLGHYGAPAIVSDAATPDAVHWNIIVGRDTLVELHDVTVSVDEAWRGLIYMTRGGRFNAHKANGAFIEVVKNEILDDDMSDASDMSDLGSSLGGSVSLGEVDNGAIDDGASNNLDYEGSPVFDTKSIDDVESAVNVSRFVAGPKDNRIRVVVERVLLGAAAPSEAPLGASRYASANRRDEGYVMAAQLGLTVEYNTQNEPFALGLAGRTVGLEVRAVSLADFISAATARQPIAGIGAALVGPAELLLETFGDRAGGRDRYAANVRLGALGLHLSTRRVQALQAVVNGVKEAVSTPSVLISTPADASMNGPTPQKASARTDPMAARRMPQPKDTTKQIVKFDIDAGRVTVVWYEFDRSGGSGMSLAQQIALSPTANINLGELRMSDATVNSMVIEPPVIRLGLDATQLTGKLHLPAATTLVSGQVLLSADVFNEQSHAYEPLIEEVGFGASARKVQVTAHKYSTVVSIVAINTLDVTIANTYVSRLQQAYTAATNAFKPKDAAASTSMAPGFRIRRMTSDRMTIDSNMLSRSQQSPTPSNTDWGSFSLALGGTCVRNRMGIPVTIVCGTARIVIRPDGPEQLVDDAGQTSYFARIGCRRGAGDDTEAGDAETDSYGPLVPVSLRDGRRQYIPFRTAVGHASRAAVRVEEQLTEHDLYEDKSVRFAVLSIAPDNGKNVATFTSR
jgi:hypothetical protein